MKTFNARPMRPKLSTVAIGVGLALSLMMGFASDTQALPIGPLQNTNNCTYAGKTYSEGSVIVIGGQKYKCDGGTWVEARLAPPNNGPDWQRPGTLSPATEMAPISAYP